MPSPRLSPSGPIIVGGSGSGITEIQGDGGIAIAAPTGPTATVDGSALLARDGTNGGLTADLAGGGNQAKDFADPTDPQDLATKAYVDEQIATGGGITPAPTSLYVSTAGSDSNPGTIGSPLATLDRALELIGDVRTYCSITILLAGSYPVSNLAKLRSFADYLDIIGDESTEIIVTTGTVASSTFQSFTVAGAPWGPDDYVGHWVRVLTGAQAGQVRGIDSNDSDTIVPLDGFAANLSPGDTFEIVRWGVTMAPVGPSPEIFGDQLYSLGLFGLHIAFSGRLYVDGIYCVGCSFPTGALYTSNEVVSRGAGLSSDNSQGVAWLPVGAAPIGSLSIEGVNDVGATLSGYLGFVVVSNSGGTGHSSGLNLGGRFALDANNSLIGLGRYYAAFQGELPITFLDDFGLLDRPCWYRMSGGEMYRISIGGSGGEALKIMLRDMSFVEQTQAFETPSFPDIALGSRWRIAYAGNGNFSNLLLDEELFVAPVFAVAGDQLLGNQYSTITRTN